MPGNESADKPLFVQNDFTVLLETGLPDSTYARYWLNQFAELVKSPGALHLYRITPLTLWNAMAAGVAGDRVISLLRDYSKLGVPTSLLSEIEKYLARYGLLRMDAIDGVLYLISADNELLHDILSYRSLQGYFSGPLDANGAPVTEAYRGVLKQELIRLGYPVEDLAGYSAGESLAVKLRETLPDGRLFTLRDYQREAIDAFYKEGSRQGGSGVVVLPCGAGKTVVGIGAMERVGSATLILTTNVTSVRQWKQEILAKTTLPPEAVGEYTGSRKDVRPVTVATYQILTHRKTKGDPFLHMKLFTERDWGLVIYDEAHLLPAPVFRVTADIQAKRRLGLTATLIREDGCEEDVFSLIGPKRYDQSWKTLEQDGWIAKAACIEIRTPMGQRERAGYLAADAGRQFRLAAENPNKLQVIEALLRRHEHEPTLIIGQYLEQLRAIADKFGLPLLTGELPHDEREKLYAKFRTGELKRLVVSKVANFAVDLPDATVAIEVSGSYGSRQEEAQRLGRILRPKPGNNRSWFYTVVSGDTTEQQYALNRQLFLIERGYRYEIEDADQTMSEGVGHNV